MELGHTCVSLPRCATPLRFELPFWGLHHEKRNETKARHSRDICYQVNAGHAEEFFPAAAVNASNKSKASTPVLPTLPRYRPLPAIR